MLATPAAHKRVLLVDDNFVTREVLSLALAADGYMVATAANGEEALGRLKAGTPVDVILLDLAMPVMDGPHFRAAQRRQGELAKIPVVVLSGSAQAEREAGELGAAGCLKKPVPTPELLEAVRRCCAPAPAV
jgi:CheY-like chemotaxis protein